MGHFVEIQVVKDFVINLSKIESNHDRKLAFTSLLKFRILNYPS